MNTKQVLYDALKSQLDVKKQHYETYYDTVTQPSLNKLKDEVQNFLSSFICFDDGTNFEFSSRTLTIRHGEYWGDKVELRLETDYKENETFKYVKLDWNSGSYDLRKNKTSKTIKTLHACFTNLSTIQDKWLNEWFPIQTEISSNDNKVNDEYRVLETALRNLSNEIKQDSFEDMKQSGFEIKEFKEEVNLDYKYIGDEREYYITSRPKSIQMQYGRSQYETIYISGFKVLGKKGNKYNVEVYREGSPTRTHDVLEKKFESFLNDVLHWENEAAEKNKTYTQQRFDKFTKAA